MNRETQTLTKADKVLLIQILKAGIITEKQKELIMEQLFDHCILLLDVNPLNEQINNNNIN